MMSWFEILKAPLETNWQSLDAVLKYDCIPHRIVVRGDEQVLFINDMKDIPLVEKRVKQWRDGTLPEIGYRRSLSSVQSLSVLRQIPMVVTLTVLSLLGFAITSFGFYELLALLAFQEVIFDGREFYVSPQFSEPLYTQWWKLITPMFLHFGVFHLAFNLLWIFEFGRRIETIQSAGRLLTVALVTGIVANVSQFWYSPDTLFGGFSGAVYGLLGYCMINSRIYNVAAIRPRRGVPALLMIWLLIGFSGIISLLGIADIANAAHLGGLISGVIVGILPSRSKSYE